MTTNWQELEAVGVWVGALGQISTAIILLIFTLRHIKAESIKSLSDMLNEWNRLSCSSEETRSAMKVLREPVIDPSVDALVFSYLNVMQTNYAMRNSGLISRNQQRRNMHNGVMMLRSVGTEKLTQYLSRGYSDNFKIRVLKEYDHLSL